ncbi:MULTISPECIES: CorA family divalent cation transporter [Microbacterium]|uniref:CorA family divalent cation transporter n=1 Tax=Microbacterium TaxID=33882 RepID=UPI0013A5AB77|nr:MULTISPECIES: CorA family divalent cation transporter [Microbacterium]
MPHPTEQDQESRAVEPDTAPEVPEAAPEVLDSAPEVPDTEDAEGAADEQTDETPDAGGHRDEAGRQSDDGDEPDTEQPARPEPAEALRIFRVGDAIEPVHDLELEDVPSKLRRVRRRDRFVWLHLVEPDEETVRQARDVLGIHPTAVADVVSRRQQPKVQKFDEHLFVMLWNVLRTDDDALLLGETYLYIGEGWLLTVQRGNGGELPDLPKLLADAPSDAHSDTMPAAYTIMAQIVDGYAKAAADIETALEELEEQVFSESGREDHRRIYRIRKKIGRVDRAVSSIAAALHESTRHLETLKVGSEQIVPYLHDLLDDAAGTAALINNQSKGLDAILSSYENNVAARQNQDMRTISAFAALLAVPTLIAGLYGMNFENIPLVQWQYGWVAIGLAIVTLDLIIYGLFKRRRWL